MYLLHRNSFYFPNRSTLIRLSFPTLDDKKSEYYPLPAGLHCQSTLTGRIANAHEKSLFCGHPCVPLCGGTGGDTFGCADLWLSVCQPSLVSPPLFDSNVVKLLIAKGVRSCVLFLLIYWPLPKSLYLYRLNTL